MARQGAGLLLHGRDPHRLNTTRQEIQEMTGKYFDQQYEARAHPQAYDPAARRQLRHLSEQLTGLAG